MTRQEWADYAAAELTATGIGSARLDAELLLTHALGISRPRLHAHPEKSLSEAQLSVLAAQLGLRVIRVPLAYIVGHRDFYGRLFKVTPGVLIPRPETEDIITIMRELPLFASVIDIGTGSGAVAVTMALEFPDARVTASDISARALKVAAENAGTYGVKIEFMKSDLLTDIPVTPAPTAIIANLPYVALGDERSPETKYEPEEALFAADDGVELILTLITQAGARLAESDYLLLESNPGQQPRIIAHATKNGFALERTRHLITVLRRL